MRNLNTKTLVIVAAICLPSMSYAQCEPKKIQWGVNCSVNTLSMPSESNRIYSSDPYRDPATKLLKGVGSASVSCSKNNEITISSAVCDLPVDPMAQSRVRGLLPEIVRNTTLPSASELAFEQTKRSNAAKSILPEDLRVPFDSAADRALDAIEEVEVWAQQNFIATQQYVNQQTSNVLSESKSYSNQAAAGVLTDSKSYTDQKSTVVLGESKSYTDSVASNSNPSGGGADSGYWWVKHAGKTYTSSVLIGGTNYNAEIYVSPPSPDSTGAGTPATVRIMNGPLSLRLPTYVYLVPDRTPFVDNPAYEFVRTQLGNTGCEGGTQYMSSYFLKEVDDGLGLRILLAPGIEITRVKQIPYSCT